METSGTKPGADPQDAKPQDSGPQDAGRSARFSLSKKLLGLTVLFVMVAEVLIYIPSIANFRNMWLQEKLDSAALVALAAHATPGVVFPPELEQQMLGRIGVDAIAIRTQGQSLLIAPADMPPGEMLRYDLTELRPIDSIASAFATLASKGDRPMMVSGKPPEGSERFEVLLHERPLRQAMVRYSRNILLLSLVISGITAALVYTALRALIVRPIERLSASIEHFAAEPDRPESVIVPSRRNDEIGVAERRFAEMQTSLRDLLAQRRRLADLGLAVSKINHDLRNILASAQLFSDRLGGADDPVVKRFAPKVIGAIDRAIGYTRSVLAYGQATEAPPKRHLVNLSRLVDDVADVLALPGNERVEWENRVPAAMEADADAEQIFRVLLNLCRNASEAVSDGDEAALVRRVWAEAERAGSVTIVRIGDTGPGVPPKARAALFQPFQGGARPGGTGLGLAIAAELVRAHGGSIELLDTPGAGAVFQFTIPDRPVDLMAARSAARG